MLILSTLFFNTATTFCRPLRLCRGISACHLYNLSWECSNTLFSALWTFQRWTPWSGVRYVPKRVKSFWNHALKLGMLRKGLLDGVCLRVCLLLNCLQTRICKLPEEDPQASLLKGHCFVHELSAPVLSRPVAVSTLSLSSYGLAKGLFHFVLTEMWIHSI